MILQRTANFLQTLTWMVNPSQFIRQNLLVKSVLLCTFEIGRSVLLKNAFCQTLYAQAEYFLKEKLLKF